eukprot:CAMPEP_0181523272 /NCGR_PEP_ID=MMETSP1110-20121109/67810_1 /TAXON_ID=174948 /ORGANISM="Symbiodinium sp., Strain CCMP421" /LENGTH=44 /DNA_ID= /DNA_START= /DNA_END= /DNA_ORIENTATION=
MVKHALSLTSTSASLMISVSEDMEASSPDSEACLRIRMDWRALR